MTFSTALLNVLWSALGVAAGAYLLMFGRRRLWASLGFIGLAATANLLAVFVAGADVARDLLLMGEWLLLGIALFVGLVGAVLGRSRPEIAVLVIGFLAGADVALWVYEIAYYVVVVVAEMSDQAALVVGAAVTVLGGMGGVWLVRKFRDEALIIITMVVGVEFVFRGLQMNENSSLTAVVLLSLGLLSLVVQFADYLRELKANTPLTQYVADRPADGTEWTNL